LKKENNNTFCLTEESIKFYKNNINPFKFYKPHNLKKGNYGYCLIIYVKGFNLKRKPSIKIS